MFYEHLMHPVILLLDYGTLFFGSVNISVLMSESYTDVQKLCLDSLHVNEEICTTLANVDKGLYALAGGYAARCSFYYYEFAITCSSFVR